MKKLFFLLALGLTTLTSSAQQSGDVPAWVRSIKVSGYGMVQYQASDKEGDEKNSFDLRLVRLAIEGRAHPDFYWKAQMQVNGNTFQDTKGIRLVDLFGEWQKYKFAQVKAGQFKRPFTFENPMHPITQGFMSYSQPVSKLAGFSDRTGEKPSNGRDIGVQVQGDLLPAASGRALIHYQVGVFNGEGINVSDQDNRKDVIGGLWVMPVAGMRIGAFGWTGSRASVGSKNRYALSADFVRNDWTFRTEYVHSQGYGSNVNAGNRADGYYALAIAPVIKNRFHVKARYDLYRESKTWGGKANPTNPAGRIAGAKTYYEVGADYLFTRNVQLNLEYARVNERTTHSNYNLVDLELDFRF